MDRLSGYALSIAAISALAAAMEMLLPDGAAKKSVETLVSLCMALAVAQMILGIIS